MVGYLGLLLILSSVATGAPARIVYCLVILLVYSAADAIWDRVVEKTWRWPISSWISGLILSLIGLLPNSSLVLLVLMPLAASAIKHLLHFGRARHLLNPAASSLFVLGLFVPTVSWWGVSWGASAAIVTALVGMFILWRQERLRTALAFLVVFFALSAAFAAVSGASASAIGQTVWILLIDGATGFFATVMLIEPVTSYFPTRRQRTIYGALVGAFSAAFSYAQQFMPYANIDPLIAGLLLGNLIGGLFFLPSVTKNVVQSSTNTSSPRTSSG